MSIIIIITAEDLASYLGQPETPDLQVISDLTNGVISDAWHNPVDPPPARVSALAYTVAARAAANRKGLSSWTLSWDDTTRTERASEAQRVGVYLTDDEIADLNPPTQAVLTRKARSIRLHVPGWS